MPSALPSPAPGTNPESAFAAFHRLAVEDAELFARLQNAPTPEEFISRTVELGAAHGLEFGAETVRAALQSARRAWFERNIA